MSEDALVQALLPAWEKCAAQAMDLLSSRRMGEVRPSPGSAQIVYVGCSTTGAATIDTWHLTAIVEEGVAPIKSVHTVPYGEVPEVWKYRGALEKFVAEGPRREASLIREMLLLAVESGVPRGVLMDLVDETFALAVMDG